MKKTKYFPKKQSVTIRAFTQFAVFLLPNVGMKADEMYKAIVKHGLDEFMEKSKSGEYSPQIAELFEEVELITKTEYEPVQGEPDYSPPGVSKYQEYIPEPTDDTVYYEPKTVEEYKEMKAQMVVGDMIFNKEAFGGKGHWYMLGLADENNLESEVLFPFVQPHFKPLGVYGMARKNYLSEHRPDIVAEMGEMELHQHCLEVNEQATQRRQSEIDAIRNDPANKVTNADKNADPLGWAAKMENFASKVREGIYNDLIYA